jgi:hypothetical protein
MRTILAKDLDRGDGDLMAIFSPFLAAMTAMTALAGIETTTVRELEKRLGSEIIRQTQRAFAYILGVACREIMLRDLEKRGLRRDDVRLRTDARGYATLGTTFGPVTFPLFSYREMRSWCVIYRSPAREKFLPYHCNCRSSPLCVEWETALGAEHPFRTAEQALSFFTRGATTLSDNTIAEHAVTVSELIGREWLFKTPAEIQTIVQTQATRDRKTNQPILYFSTDAHALRRYVDETWHWDWKMVNGIRLWCEDATTGKLIHLGGEFLWGTIEVTALAVRHLISAGILPNGTQEWKAIDARLVFVSDASLAITDHILPLLPEATLILDPYHLLRWFAELASVVFRGKGRQRKAHALYERAWKIVLRDGRPMKSTKKSSPRRGHEKRRASQRHAYNRTTAAVENSSDLGPEALTQELLELLAPLKPRSEDARAALEALVKRLTKNLFRMDYANYLGCGLQIGSGPMESFHTTGSQRRLKIPGARWLEASSQAILRLRMLQLSGRWGEFWSQPGLEAKLAPPFARRAAQRRDERKVGDQRRADRRQALQAAA